MDAVDDGQALQVLDIAAEPVHLHTLGRPLQSTCSASGRSPFKDPRGYQSAKADRALVVMVLVAVTLVLLVYVFRLVAVVLVAVAFVLVVRQSLLLMGGMG